MLEPIRLAVERLGRRGEGVATLDGGPVYIPYALPGEIVLADVDGERGEMRRLIESRSDRLEPFCPSYGRCGGCAVQTLPPAPYAAWKRDLVAAALDRAGVRAEVAPLVDAHGEGRRRVTFHARFGPRPGTVELGFMEARTHRIVDIAACPVLSPALAGAVPAAQRIARDLVGAGKPLDILVTATDAGLDVDLRGPGRIDESVVRRLVETARALDLARLSNHGDILVEARPPLLRIGHADVVLPPGAFLQATRKADAVLARLALDGVGNARKVADLFCGIGTFALRLAEDAAVSAWDGDARAVEALTRAAQRTSGLRPVIAATRDLFRRPLLAEELARFDAVVFDPPRAGADAQTRQIVGSGVPAVVAVSCDPGTFARDAATLIKAGYGIEGVVPVDQFRHAAHVEIVAVFRRGRSAASRKRLLS